MVKYYCLNLIVKFSIITIFCQCSKKICQGKVKMSYLAKLAILLRLLNRLFSYTEMPVSKGG